MTRIVHSIVGNCTILRIGNYTVPEEKSNGAFGEMEKRPGILHVFYISGTKKQVLMQDLRKEWG